MMTLSIECGMKLDDCICVSSSCSVVVCVALHLFCSVALVEMSYDILYFLVWGIQSLLVIVPGYAASTFWVVLIIACTFSGKDNAHDKMQNQIPVGQRGQVESQLAIAILERYVKLLLFVAPKVSSGSQHLSHQASVSEISRRGQRGHA